MNEPDFISSVLKNVPGLDVVYAIGSMGGSNDLFEKTLLHTVRQIPLNVSEMDNALNSGDLGAFAVRVHGVKSALRHVGKTALANDAEALEIAAKAGDKTYCNSNYTALREELLRFYAQVNEAAGIEPNATAAVKGNIIDYVETLKQTAEAAELCDSMSAYDILLPMTKIRFTESIDDLIIKASNALDQFKPFEALEYIAELQSQCINRQLL